MEKHGGKLVSGYLAFGKYDTSAMIDMPNNVNAASFAMAVAAGGACSKVLTTPLMTTKEGMDAMKKAGASTYKPATARATKKK